MKKKKLQNYDDIMNYLDNLNSERKNINSQLAVMGISLFNAESREKKSKLKKRLKEIKHIFKYFDGLFSEYTTFDKNILLPFLAEYLSKNTDTKYITCKGVSSVFTGKVWLYSYYNFIYPVKDILIFKQKGYDIDDDISYSDLESSTDSRIIALNDYDSYTLMNLEGLLDEFSAFPELKDVVIRLIDMKLIYPEMSDEERLLRSLSNVKSNKEKSVMRESFNKEYPNGDELKYMNLSEIYSVKKR